MLPLPDPAPALCGTTGWPLNVQLQLSCSRQYANADVAASRGAWQMPTVAPLIVQLSQP
jgi:hypothetical protein